MKKKFIRITYRHIIDINAKTNFDRSVFGITYSEFLLKSQAYNPGNKMDTFNVIRQADGRANSLHYKIALAASGIMESLQQVNPFVVDYAGKNIAFDDYKFELLESAVSDKTKHVLAISLVSPPYVLHDMSGDILVLSEQDAIPQEDGMYNTFMLKTEKKLYISNYREVISEQETESDPFVS
ncbi:MAG: hypothetical protein QM687_06900 [Ferruginibacter sp.]